MANHNYKVRFLSQMRLNSSTSLMDFDNFAGIIPSDPRFIDSWAGKRGEESGKDRREEGGSTIA